MSVLARAQRAEATLSPSEAFSKHSTAPLIKTKPTGAQRCQGASIVGLSSLKIEFCVYIKGVVPDFACKALSLSDD